MPSFNKSTILTSTAMLAIALSTGAAMAQTAPAGTESASSVEEVVVTGSRIVRDGFAAPTPLAVVGAESIQQQAGNNVASVLYSQPVFSGNTTPNRTSNVPSSGTGGLNLLNIRGLGATRSLVLVDGARFVPTLINQINAVDIGNIPQQLIARVETVTGGASAVYGSDAVGGVTNFVLDNRFSGFKADVSGSVSQYGDGGAYTVDTAFGRAFLDGRAHVVASVLFADNAEISDTSNRDWDKSGSCILLNPAYTLTNGQPRELTSFNCGGLNGKGGTINSGPLRGTSFGENGAQYQFNYGVIGGNVMQGGDYLLNSLMHLKDGWSILPQEQRQNFYSRATFDVAENLSVYVSGSYGRTYSNLRGSTVWKEVAPGVTVFTDNPFIPANLRPSLAGTTSFQYLTHLTDNWHMDQENNRYATRLIVGAEGNFSAFGKDWDWNTYYQYGLSRTSLRSNTINNVRFNRAVDAVTNARGQIVCRVNQVTVTDPSCIPYNLFGTGVNSEQALRSVEGIGRLNQSNTQDVFSATITGSPFSIWAGPVDFALNAEHRREEAYGSVDGPTLRNEFHSGNYKPINGEMSVSEVAIEALVPLLRDVPLVKSLDLELAGRATNYSTSGTVYTWKVGGTYEVNDDLRLRGNVSRDIRAANLGELYAFGSAPTAGGVTLDPFTNVPTATRSSSTGNPNLTPEVANAYGFGGVYSPSFLPGFRASIDYWKVDIEDVITNVGGLTLVNLCFQGNADACKGVIRRGPAIYPGVGANAGQMFALIDEIIGFGINLNTQTQDGIDYAAAYSFPLENIFSGMEGDIRLNYTHSQYLGGEYASGLPGGVTTRDAEYWRSVATATYSTPALSVTLVGRFNSKNYWTYGTDPQVVECTSGCPTIASLPSGTVTRDFVYRNAKNHYDLNVTYTLENLGGTQIYLNIRNLLNTDPPKDPRNHQPVSYHDAQRTDDTIGRYYRAGVRFKF
jgi:outer membrane receptor protein involved in Fe transport